MIFRISSTILAIFLFLSAEASHIVGGEFFLKWTGRGNRYTLGLYLYYDDIHAQGDLKDRGIKVSVFEKGTDMFVDEIALPLQAYDNFVQYKVLECVKKEDVRTRILEYHDVVILDPEIYTHPKGYYVTYERCCRNEIIDNIEDPAEVGMTFYMEFPPVIKNDVTFRNSSPVFKPVEGEYFCLNTIQKYDFGAIDSNKDSLVYSLVTPYKGFSAPDNSQNAPVRNPGPYPEVDWIRGFSRENMIPGNPALSINRFTGEITVKPNLKGLFVMSVMVEEYRNKIKIGVNRRDFQFLVVECPINIAPAIKIYGDNAQLLSEKDSLKLDFGSEKCYTITVSDSSSYFEDEIVNVRVTGGTLPGSVSSIAPGMFNLTAFEPVKRGQVCLQTCKTLVLEKDSLFTLQLVAGDDACPMPLTDTLNIKVFVRGLNSNKPKIGVIPNKDLYSVSIGDTVNFVVFATDNDTSDMIHLKLNTDNLNADMLGMTFPEVSGKDSVSSTFSWVVKCEHLKASPLSVKFDATDESCVLPRTDSTRVDFKVYDHKTEITSITVSNLITPNGDNKNDYFYLPNIPKGNCSSYFASVVIYNRWGGLVYKSNDPDFKWTAADIPDGVYFVEVDLNSDKKRGWLQLVR